jgi:hypothetical protein
MAELEIKYKKEHLPPSQYYCFTHAATAYLSESLQYTGRSMRQEKGWKDAVEMEAAR